MFRYEEGVYVNPIYDKGDYPIELRVYEAEDVTLGYSPLFRYASRGGNGYRELYDDAIEEECAYQARRLLRTDGREKRKEIKDHIEFLRTMDAFGIEPMVINPQPKLNKTPYHTPRLYLEDDLPYISPWFDEEDGVVVCCNEVVIDKGRKFIQKYFSGV